MDLSGGEIPEFAAGFGPVAALDGAVGFNAHGLTEARVGGDFFDVGGEVVGVQGAGDEAGFSVVHEVLGPARVGDNAGDATGEGFEDYVSEGVVGAGEEEDVGGGEGAGEFEAG